MRLLIALLVSSQLVGCGFFQKRQPNPLVTSECPDLTKLADDSFAATSAKLKEVADQYHLCRSAAVLKEK